MKSIRYSRLTHISGILFAMFVWLANNSNPPTGQTGAPFDSGNCNGCHDGNSYTGTVEVTGMPATVAPSTVYPLTITMTPSGGSPVKGGFQLVAVDGNNTNSGNLTNSNAQSGTEFFNGREYLEHRGGKNFGGNPISWSFTWTSPASAAGNTIKFYFIGNFCNGNGGSSGDIAYAFSETYPFAGGAPVTAVITGTTNVSCNGGNNGSATVEAGGGAPPYTYAWNNGQTQPTATNLAAGTYTVTVTGSSGSGSATATAVITQPPVISLPSPVVTGSITCINTAVTVTANATGGVGGFTYAWSNGNTGNPTTYINPGPGSVTVTDANNCTKTASFTVATNTTTPNAAANAPAAFSCNNPTLVLSGTGSSVGANFAYQWVASGGGTIISGANTLSPTVTGCGTYTLQVTNNTTGCTNTASVTPACNISPPDATATGTTLTCAAPSGTISGNSTTPNVTYSWVGPNGFTSPVQNPTVSAAGTYTVTVRNPSNNCTATATASVTQNIAQPTATATGGVLTCAANTVQIFGSSTTPGATYAWSGPCFSNNSQNQQNPTVCAVGVYTLTVTNPANGCTRTATATVSFNNTPPNLSATGGTLSCLATTVQACATSTTPGATIQWLNSAGGVIGTTLCVNITQPGVYTVVATNPANGCTATATATIAQDVVPPNISATGGQTTCSAATTQICAASSTPNALYAWSGPGNFISTVACPTVSTPGVYMVTALNPANGCTATAAAMVTQDTTPPNVTTTGGQITCASATAQICASSSTPNATYSWTGPGNFTSNLACPTTSTVGTYTVTVGNPANGCTATATAVVTLNTAPPIVNIGPAPNLNCNLTAVVLNASSSSQGALFAYLWTASNGGHIVSGSNTLTPTVDSMGIYTLLITNTQTGCTATGADTIGQTPAVTAAAAAVNVSCFGNSNGSVSASGGGGTLPFDFVWSTGDSMAIVNNLAVGTYTVTATDADGCTATASATVGQPAVLVILATSTGQSAVGVNDGTATAAPSGGTAPYTFLWSNDSTTAVITGLAPGNFTVTATDANGCTAVQTVTVNAFGCNLQASISFVNITCQGAANGTATITPTGANGPFTYLWSNEAATATVTGLAPGTYTATVTDAANCEVVLSTSIAEPPALLPNATSTGVTGVGQSDGTATASPTGGTAPYTFLWDNNSTSATIKNLAPGSYTVVVTDANTCTSSQTVTVNPFDCNVSASAVATHVTCFGGNDGTATGMLAGATGTVGYKWSNGATTAQATGLGAGTFTVTATDAAGCSATATVSITEPTQLVATVSDVTTVPCPLDPTGTATITVTGGIPPYTYQWAGGGNPTGFPAGTHTVTITDANGCKTTASFTILSLDSEAPALNCPGSIIICGADIVTYPLPTVTDNCAPTSPKPVLISGLPSGSPFKDGVTTQVFSATDLTGNSATCSFNITVNPLPDVIIEGYANDTNGLGLGYIKITPVSNAGPFVFIWIKDNAFFSNEEDLDSLSAGSYRLMMTDVNGCGVSLAPIQINNTVGTGEPNDLLASARLWPNPTSTAFRLELEGVEVAAAHIFTPQGRMIQTITPADLASEVLVGHLPAGLYYLRITTREGWQGALKWVKTGE